ncbi:putative siroheme biosynthesis protein [Clavispora lusitaniae]|uniref:Siroheme biosynthesis protein n=1 Tax=Clavispora lusitaniae TaxID=36911 RepID=A0ACD0WS68_CLALS|nr:putative siroheme biosynthesis protein [Clavispora lusitaniae]QFZ35919.1 putative siroheme biosynthesis protein [Clavispora lusitaniae]QFZ41601.1 putative siroheme biosynthesis protein [Clavispora lusitaniae]QFZ47279.1 putative siroheme biosynthesis protein [Clavispora lusitaniae]QFZ52956.1 putative siroheme biosynthesis protein [Clavispora lusitaniae]
MSSPGSLLLAWQVKDKHCLVIGGGDVGLSRVEHMLRANAKVTVVTGGKVHPKLKTLSEEGKLYKLLERDYTPSDLTMYENAHLDKMEYQDIGEEQYGMIDDMVKNNQFACVCCCIDDPAQSTKVYYQCKWLRIPVNIADKPPMCDFYFGSMFNQDALQIMISTNGKSPRLSKMIKDDIAKQFAGLNLNEAVDNLGRIRARLREELPEDDLDTIDARMQWIKTLTDFFSLRQWSQLELTEQNIDRIVEAYPQHPPKNYEAFQEFLR